MSKSRDNKKEHSVNKTSLCPQIRSFSGFSIQIYFEPVIYFKYFFSCFSDSV